MSRRNFLKQGALVTSSALVPASLVELSPSRALAGPNGGGATQVFNFADFTGDLSSLYFNHASPLGSALQLINNGSGHHGAQAWYRTQQSPGPFTTNFSFQFKDITGVVGGVQSGFSFVMQNIAFSPPGQASEQASRLVVMLTCADTAALN